MTEGDNESIGNVPYGRHPRDGAADIFIGSSPRDGVRDDVNHDGRPDIGEDVRGTRGRRGE
jgi:hypothetical protein